MTTREQLFRAANEEQETRVTHIELFFDLVFVFAVTQLSHRLLEHLTPIGAFETLILLLAVWWVWVYTSWATNWLDPDRAVVRLMLIALMCAGLILSSSVGKAFENSTVIFALAYVAMQLGRTLFMVWAYHGHGPEGQRNFLRITIYFLLSAPLWIWGAYVGGEWRLVAWSAAVVIEYAGPILRYRMPVLGASTAKDWDISGAHMADRCALFIIIALGEAILVTGATFAQLEQTNQAWGAFLLSFVASGAMWWIYFDIGAKRGSEMIEAAENTGEVARSAYTYMHMPIVAGIVVTAVADEMMMTHPLGHSEAAFVLAAVGGPALFLLGNQMFKWQTTDSNIPPLSHSVGLILLGVVGITGWLQHWQPVNIGIGVTAALLVTASWEWLALHGGWQRWAPWMGPRLGRLFRRQSG